VEKTQRTSDVDGDAGGRRIARKADRLFLMKKSAAANTKRAATPPMAKDGGTPACLFAWGKGRDAHPCINGAKIASKHFQEGRREDAGAINKYGTSYPREGGQRRPKRYFYGGTVQYEASSGSFDYHF
jgi:hypothetical protein